MPGSAGTKRSFHLNRWWQQQLADSSLRIKVTIGVALPLVILLGIFTGAEYIRQRQVLLENLSLFASYSAQIVEDNLLHQMLENDLRGVQEMLDTLGRREEFQALYILDNEGEIIFAPGAESLGTILDNHEADCQPCHRLPAEERPSSVIVVNNRNERVFRSMHPLENSPACSECHDPEERLIGLLLTDISVAPAMAALERDLLENLLWWSLTVLVVIVVVNLVLDRTVFSRLQRLALAMSRFGQGVQTVSISDRGSDEIARLTGAFDEMAEKIDRRQKENDLLSDRLRQQNIQRGELLKGLIDAQENERKRVAREIHDELGQSLGALALQFEGLRRLMEKDPARALEQLERIQPLINMTTGQMYELILDLRPSSLDDLGLVPTLKALANRLTRSNDLRFSFESDGLPDRLPPEIETACFRIFQEALNNAVRHAGATQIEVSLTCHDHTIAGRVRDDGRGFDLSSINLDGSSPRGLGLLGMRERAAQCSGAMEIDSRPGHGTQIHFYIPLPEVDCD